MNNVIIYVLLPLIGSIFIQLTIFYSMDRIGTNIVVSRLRKNLIIWGYIIAAIILSLLQNGILNLLVMLMIPIIGHYLYNNLRLYIVYYVGFIVAVYLTDALITNAIQMLFLEGIIYFANDQASYIIMVIVLRFMEFMVIKILVGIIQKKHYVQITRKQMINSFLMPLFSIINLFSMMIFMQIYLSEENLILFFINLTILIGLNIYFTSVFDIISRNNHLENELNLYRQQQTIQVRYYENLEQKYDSTRKLIHDIRNHIQSMERLYEEQKNMKGCQYAKDVHDMLNQLGQKYYTSNKVLNIILNDKVQMMQAQGITEDIKIAELDLSFIRDVDITTLFANILDNSIDAARSSDEKLITLRVAMIHDFITITLKNSITEEPIHHENSFLTTKKNHEGLGLKNVERVVKNYKGDVQYEWGNKYFITRIMLAH